MIRALFISLILTLHAVAVGPAPSPPPDSVIVAASKVWDGSRVHEGLRDPYLVEVAQDHADYMARVDQQGHQRFKQRAARIRRDLMLSPTEVCAETWIWQEYDRPLELGKELFRCWEQSSGHWSVVSQPHRRYGDGLAKSTTGIWYGCVIVAD
jgi:hypothetical protein